MAHAEVPRHVVHLVGHLSEAVFHLLGPATAALARAGAEQTVVLVDHEASRPMLCRIDPSVDLVAVAPRRDAVAQWRTLRRAFAELVARRVPDAVHLHGFVACVNGGVVLGRMGSQLPTFFSPHGGLSMGPLRAVAALAHALGRADRRAPDLRAIAHGAAEARAMHDGAQDAVSVIEGPVDRAYFDIVHRPARTPLLLASGSPHDVRGAEAFDQLAVLLGGDALGVSFNWIGPLDDVSAQRLAAASVGLFKTPSAAERATRLAAGWIFVALGTGRGFPSGVAEAMAVGLPCVALDTPAHRDLVRQGETGYLCRSQAEVVDRIAQLIDTAPLRERMGAAGRVVAAQRFSEARFQAALASAYGLRSQARAVSGEGAATIRDRRSTASGAR